MGENIKAEESGEDDSLMGSGRESIRAIDVKQLDRERREQGHYWIVQTIINCTWTRRQRSHSK